MGRVQAGEGHRPCRRSRRASSQGTSAARRAIESVVATVFEVDPRELQARSRGAARTAFARQVAMYLAHVACGISLTDVGALFGRDRTTVSHACSLVEDKRDDPDLDCRLEHLEHAISCLMDALSLRRVGQ
jgi:chromosomal replication initiation ATPase DnaA